MVFQIVKIRYTQIKFIILAAAMSAVFIGYPIINYYSIPWKYHIKDYCTRRTEGNNVSNIFLLIKN